MQVKYGTYAFPTNGVKVTAGRKIMEDASNTPYEYTDSIRCDGYLEGAGQQALTDAEIALKIALLVPGQDLVLYQDSGAASATVLRAAGALVPPRVTDGPNFRDEHGAEYAVQRHFDFTVEATYPIRTTGTYLEFHETVEISGGGALYVVRPALVGPPQRQLVYEQTPCTATQSGSAVGYGDYPPVPGPLWPFALRETLPVRRSESPDRRGLSKYTRYKVEWSYQYAWVTRLFGVPNLWPLGA